MVWAQKVTLFFIAFIVGSDELLLVRYSSACCRIVMEE